MCCIGYRVEWEAELMGPIYANGALQVKQNFDLILCFAFDFTRALNAALFLRFLATISDRFA